MIPAVRQRKATGFTFGGPPARTILAATLSPVKDAMRVRPLVTDLPELRFNGSYATTRKP